MILFILYLLSVLLAFVLFCADWYLDFEEILVKDVLIFVVLSSIPVCGLGGAILVFIYGSFERSNINILNKMVF